MPKIKIPNQGKTIEIDVCCDNMAAATHPCTDSEGLGRLFTYCDGNWCVATHDIFLSFCPWCGNHL